MKMRLMLVLCAGLALMTVGIATATAGGGDNNAASKPCKDGGWQNLVREDGTTFKNQGDCVSYAVQGGVLEAKPTCVAGSDNFSDDAGGTQPTTFSGGTFDTAYGPDDPDVSFDTPGIRVDGDAGETGWFGLFATGTHVVWTGEGVNSFQLTFTEAVGSVTLDVESNRLVATTDTLTAYDASDIVVDTDFVVEAVHGVNTLTVTSASDNIDHFTVATDDGGFGRGLAFSNIVWDCN
jgi:hypothetical protein